VFLSPAAPGSAVMSQFVKAFRELSYAYSFIAECVSSMCRRAVSGGMKGSIRLKHQAAQRCTSRHSICVQILGEYHVLFVLLGVFWQDVIQDMANTGLAMRL